MRDHAHLFVDVVLSHALREGCQLALDVLTVLAPQCRSPEYLGARAVTGGAGRHTALRIARIEAVVVFVSMATPHRTRSPVVITST